MKESEKITTFVRTSAISPVSSRTSSVYNNSVKKSFDFDAKTYQDGSYQYVSAVEKEQIQYQGRFLHTGSKVHDVDKANTAQFDWPGCSISIRVTNTALIALRLNGGGNFFNIFINDAFHCVLKTTNKTSVYEVESDLFPGYEYDVQIYKRTEPQYRGTLSSYKVCVFHGFLIDNDAIVLPHSTKFQCRIEFIGDGMISAYNNECEMHSKRKRKTNGRLQNVYNGYAGILTRMLQANSHIIGWNNKGIHSNFAEWGDTLSTLWKNTIASRPGTFDFDSWTSDIVVVHLGYNDLCPPVSADSDVLAAYVEFLREIRRYRPLAHIFCVICHRETREPQDESMFGPDIMCQLQEIVEVALLNVTRFDRKIHLASITVPMTHKSSSSAHGHCSVSDHALIAEQIAQLIEKKTKYSIRHAATVMPYPIHKEQIRGPIESRQSCLIQ